jgi:DNA-binding CsgD family transcriptional regulator
VDGLLERNEELARLAGLLDRSRDGHGSLLLLGGEAGIGKTSLVYAWRERAEDASFLVGVCEPLSVPVPLGPLRELAAAAGAPGLVEASAGDRLGLANALLSQLPHGTVAVVEDAHWADPGTLDVVRLVAHRLPESGVVFVLTYRDDEIGANRELARLVGDLVRHPWVERVRLGPLSESAVRTLTGTAGADLRELVRLTGGNPFLVAEAAAAENRLPETVRDATLARVGRLSPAGRGVVDAAAVIGQRVEPGLLDAVVPGSAAAVEEAIAKGVLIEDGPLLGFRHELTRQAIEDSISALRLRELHARVLAALESAPREAPPALLAHHAERAGRAAEALLYAERAADEAERVGSLREASLQLDRALAHGAALPAAERFELLIRYVRSTNFAGAMEEGWAGAEEAASLAERELGPLEQGRALTVLAWTLWSLDRVVESRQAGFDAVARLESGQDPAALAHAQAAELRTEAIAFDSDLVVEQAPEAIDVATAAGLEEVAVDISISLGVARGHRGEPGASAALVESLERAQAGGYTIPTIRAYVNAVAVAADERAHGLVDDLAARALDRLDEFQTTIPRENVLVSRALSLLDRGRLDEALEQAAASRQTHHGAVPLALLVEGLVRARRGEPGADEILADAWSRLADIPEGWRHGMLRSGLAEAAWLRGDVEGVLAQVDAGLAAPFARQLARSSGELALWAFRQGRVVEPPRNTPAPILLELDGDWRCAVRAWKRLDAPYEAALAALPGDERAGREAMAALRRLGAEAAARAFAHSRAGTGSVPRGPRSSTLAHPAGLTRREQEVLAELATGATNPAIATTLHLSERTVAHHVSSILAKLESPTRTAAVERARRDGLLPQDRPAAAPR